ncbi:MAG TPA: dienelactone hydrolase family protein [Acidobacteriota bacterium]|nr:dienelactone hydrolase family protein [Acidobacteriota bacterium]
MQNRSTNAPSETDLTRREFVATTLSAGIALAASPVSAQTITTGSSGMVAGDVKIPVPDGEISGYRARPDSGGPFPIVLIAYEVFGLQEHIKDICRRFAREGYLAIAPDLYYRQGDVSKLENFDEIFKIVSKVPDAQVMSDLDAAVEWAAKNKGDAKRLGVTGFCWGGRITWLYAAHSPKVRAGTAWYGRLVGDTAALQPKNPIDLVTQLKAPVLGLYGGQDQGIPLDTIEKMRDALKKAGNPSEIIVYPEAPHGFFADTRPSYRKEAAEDGWRRLLAWFKKYGAA